MVAHVPVPEHRSVTGTFCKENVLPVVVNHYVTKRPRTDTRGLKLLHDNAPAHRSAVVQDYLREQNIEVMPHPPYSPDLSPCDFWLNPYIKTWLRGRRCESRCNVGSALYQCVKQYT